MTGKRETVNFLPVNSCVVTHVLFAAWLPQKKLINPDIFHHPGTKYANNVSCVDQWSSVKKSQMSQLLQIYLWGPDCTIFGENWQALGASPKVVTVFKEDYILPFQFWPNLTRSPTIISCYVNPHRNLYLVLHQFMNKMQ